MATAEEGMKRQSKPGTSVTYTVAELILSIEVYLIRLHTFFGLKGDHNT